MSNIGFMQGRLCDQVDGMIQAFPWSTMVGWKIDNKKIDWLRFSEP